jgi:hypothetical protein
VFSEAAKTADILKAANISETATPQSRKNAWNSRRFL